MKFLNFSALSHKREGSPFSDCCISDCEAFSDEVYFSPSSVSLYVEELIIVFDMKAELRCRFDYSVQRFSQFPLIAPNYYDIICISDIMLRFIGLLYSVVERLKI